MPSVESLYGAFRAPARRGGTPFRLDASAPGPGGRAADGVLAWLDDQLTVGVQYRRPRLLFVHAAAIARRRQVALLVAPSGGGKSTTTWAAMHHGFALLSDELAPVEPGSLLVHPFPRAICLKSRPPRPYDVPPGSLGVSGSKFVPPRLLPTPLSPPARLALLAFVSYHPEDKAPSMREISPAESAARLYANTLNALAHAGEGLDAVTRIASRVRSFVLRSGDLSRTCALLAEALER